MVWFDVFLLENLTGWVILIMLYVAVCCSFKI